MYYLICYDLPGQEQISERETQETSQQSSMTQDTSHQYARFASPISDNGVHIIKLFFVFIE